MPEFAIGVDVGATFIKFALVSRSGEMLAEARELTEGEKGKAIVVRNVLKGVATLLDGRDRADLLGVGIGVPGVVGYDGVIKTLTNVPDWENVHLAALAQAEMRRAFGFAPPIYVENDANLAALGESEFGAGKAFRDFVMITLGTGVGGGIILNKKIFRGSTGGAGEIGHVTINYDGETVHAGIRGTIEGLIGHRQITAYARALLSQSPSKIIGELCDGDLSKLDPERLTEAAKRGDEVALRVWRYVGEVLGAGIGTLVSILDARKFVVGGGVAGAGEFLLKPTLEQAQRFTLAAMREGLEILPATLGNRAGVMGAAALCFQGANALVQTDAKL
ncbi:MAG: ROK family protein [Chloroherpetonaceae bacterium]|nr:ROK family protein [Chloroherpetonaceae bacterium]MDW8437942.1 ROK family protein [Chloroherpetonaceae bacterium]